MKYKQCRKTFNLQKLSYPKQEKKRSAYHYKQQNEHFNDFIHHWYNGIYHGINLYILGILLGETRAP